MTDASAATPEQIQLSGALMFYRQPEPLNRQQHAKLGLVRQNDKPFAFAAETHLLPLLLPEFNQAALSYPIIFAGDPRRPVAVMGVQAGDNLFVSRDKGFAPDAYVPFYVRRYPFALANDHDNKQAVVIVDRGSDLVSEQPDQPFFENGEPTAVVTDMIQFCEAFEQARLTTDAFCDIIEGLDLFEIRYTDFNARNADGTPAPPQRVAEYFAVSEEKLNALPAEKFAELRNNGALRQIYAHLLSLAGWERLMAMAVSRSAAPQAANA